MDLLSHIAYRSTVSDFQLTQPSHFCDQSSFHIIDLKLDTEVPSLNVQLHRSGLLQHDARWSVVMNIYAQAGFNVGL